MADFCYQCSQELFPPQFWGKDFEGLTTVADLADGKAAVVLCEECGPIQVDDKGRCLTHKEHPVVLEEEQ